MQILQSWYSNGLFALILTVCTKTKFLKPKPLCVCEAKDSVNENENELFSGVLDRARFGRIFVSVGQIIRYIYIRLNILIQFADYETKAVQRPLQITKNHGFFFFIDTIVRILWTINFSFGEQKQRLCFFSVKNRMQDNSFYFLFASK